MDKGGNKDGLLVVGKAGATSKDGGIKVKTWKQKFFILFGSTLYYYNKKTSYAPTGAIELQKVEITEDVKTDKKFAFGLKDAEKGKLFIFCSANEEERVEWLNQVKANKNKESQPPPTNPFANNRKGLKYSLETNVASSMLGRKLIKEAIPTEAWQVLDTLCSFIKQVKGEDIASRFKKDFIKIGTKIALLHHNKLISDEEIFQWRKTFLKLGSIVVDFYQMPSIFDCQVIVGFLRDIKSNLEERLKPKLTAHSTDKIQVVFDLISEEALVTNLFQKKKWKELETIAVLIRTNVTTLREPLS